MAPTSSNRLVSTRKKSAAFPGSRIPMSSLYKILAPPEVASFNISFFIADISDSSIFYVYIGVLQYPVLGITCYDITDIF